MDIVIIGSGNAAAVLGRKLKAAGHRIRQVVGRNTTAASELAYEWDTESTNYLSLINKQADVYLVAVADQAIGELVADLKLPGKVVAHTAASVSKDILKNVTRHYGVFYPLQSLRKEMADLPRIPIFVDASDDKARDTLGELALSVSGYPIQESREEERLKMHVAAVVVSNFTNYLYMLTEAFCKKEGIEFKLLLPLIEETVNRLKTISPARLQTGPAIRQDHPTIGKHLALLEPHPELKKVYAFLSACISGEGGDQ